MAIEQENETGVGGWEPEKPESVATGVPCPQLGKRHRWQGGTVCVRCGATKEEVAPKAEREPGSAPTGPRVGAFETLAAAMWIGFATGVEYQPFILNQKVKREDGTELDRPVKVAVAKSLQMEAAIAGRRIDKAFHKANPVIYGLAARWFKKTGWATELAPLMIPPLVVGIMATQPAIAAKFKPQLTMALMPVLIEAAKLAQQQAKLMETMEGINQETMDMAEKMLTSMLGSNDTTNN